MGAGASSARAVSAEERSRCVAVFKLAKKLVRDGTGEGQPAHGFCIILADGRVLFATKPNGKPKLGKIMNPVLYDYRDKGLYLTDANVYATLSNLAREDGAIAIDFSTGQILGGNYSIFDLRSWSTTRAARRFQVHSPRQSSTRTSAHTCPPHRPSPANPRTSRVLAQRCGRRRSVAPL